MTNYTPVGRRSLGPRGHRGTRGRNGGRRSSGCRGALRQHSTISSRSMRDAALSDEAALPEETVSQVDLFPRPAARQTDPATSHAAARRFTPASHYARIPPALELLGPVGATHRELARETGLEPVQVARRLGELGLRGAASRRAVSA